MLKYLSIFILFLFFDSKAQKYIGQIGGEKPIYYHAVYDGNNRIYSTDGSKIFVSDTNGRIIKTAVYKLNGDSSLAWTAQLITKKGVLVLLTNKLVAFLDTNFNTISWSANFPSGIFLRSVAEIDNNHVYIAADNTSTFFKIRISDAAQIRSFNLKKSIYVPRNFHVDAKNGDLLLHVGVLWRFDTLGNDKGNLNIYHAHAWFTSDSTFISGNDVKNTIEEYSVTGRKIMSMGIKSFGMIKSLYKPNVVFKTPGGNYLVLNSTQKTSIGGYLYKFSSTGDWLNTLGRPVTISTNSWDSQILPTPEILALDSKGNLQVLCGLNNNEIYFGPRGVSRGALCTFTPEMKFKYANEIGSSNIEHFMNFKNQFLVQSDGKLQTYDSNLVAVGTPLNCSDCGEFLKDENENTFWVGHRSHPGLPLKNFVLFKNNKYGTFPQALGKSGYSLGDKEIVYTTSLAKLKNGNFVVADLNQHQVHIIDNNGNHLQFVCSYGNQPENVCLPVSITVDQYDNIFISEAGNHRIKVLNKSGNFLGNFGSFGKESGQFNTPASITIDTFRKILYVADRNNARVQVFKLNYPIEHTLKTEKYQKNQLFIYPNPAKDKLYVESKNIITKITVNDFFGKEYINIMPISSNISIDITSLSKGSYYISIFTNSGLFTKKLTVL